MNGTAPDVSPLAQSLLDANDKTRKFLAELEDAARAMGHKNVDEDPGLRISKAVYAGLVDSTEKAIASGDVVAMVQAAQAHGIGA